MARDNRSKTPLRNVLPNQYIPVLSSKVSRNVLNRLPKNSLLELMYVWPKLVNTQPHLEQENSQDLRAYASRIRTEAKQLKSLPRVSKRKVIDKILFEHWNKGLNLLQLSQVDCQLIIDRPNAYYWVKSTVRDSKNQEVPISLAPQLFLERLVAELSTLYLTYVYVCRHPILPLVLVRIQVFDLQPLGSTQTSLRPHISSHKPYFFAIPLNSPHIIHSPGNDMVANIVLQVVERSLPQTPTNLLKLVSDENEKPVRSLESMHIFLGNSRFGNSLGAWTPYADGTVDLLPFGALEKHSSLATPPAEDTPDNDEDPELTKLKKIANLRFKGSTTGVLKSKKLYDDNKPTRTRKATKTNQFQNTSDSENEFEIEDHGEPNEFASFAPIQYSELLIKEKINETDTEPSSIKITFSGPDVFAGLHELSVSTTDKEKMAIDPSKIPNYLTGEVGTASGIVENKQYRTA